MGRLARRLIAHQQGVTGPEQGGGHRQQGGPAEIVGPGGQDHHGPGKPRQGRQNAGPAHLLLEQQGRPQGGKQGRGHQQRYALPDGDGHGQRPQPELDADHRQGDTQQVQPELVGHQGLAQAVANQPGQQADQGDQILVKGDLGGGKAEFEADILAQAVDGGETEASHHHPDCTGNGRVPAWGCHGIRVTDKKCGGS